MRHWILIGLAAILVISGGQAWAQNVSIGVIRVSNNAEIQRDGNIIKAAEGQSLREKDVLLTGPAGSLGIVLNDNSVVSLGANSRLSLDMFEFVPRENRLGFLASLAHGTLEYISGKISKLARDAVKFKTPFTTVAVRGTRLLIRAED